MFDQINGGNNVKWIMLGMAALLSALFLLLVTVILIYRFFFAPDRMHFLSLGL